MLRRLVIPLVASAALAACGGGGGPDPIPVPVPDTIRTVTGEIGYFTSGPRLSNRDADGRLIPTPGLLLSTLPAPAPFFPVDILAPDGRRLAQTLTGPDGVYSVQVNFGKNPATQVIVRTRAEIRLPFGTIIRVLADRFSPGPYTHATPVSGDPAQETMTIDLAIPREEGAAAYRMLTVLYPAFLAAAQGLLGDTPRDMDLLWSPGNGTASSVDGSDPAVARVTIAGGLPGDASSNRDEWDECKVVRLVGQSLLEDHWHVVVPAGETHDGNMVPSAAWREGFLDFWSCIARGSRLYWETEGEAAAGRVVRFFDIESFFDPTLPPLAGDDPNVYQPADATGIGSRFTVAETLWDIHDGPLSDDGAGLDFPLFLTLRFLQEPRPGFSYPYLVTLFEAYDRDNSISDVKIDNLLRSPEPQGIPLLADPLSPEVVWPRWFAPNDRPGNAASIGFTKQLFDEVDTVNPDPLNPEIGQETQRYFIVDTVLAADITATLDTTGDLLVEILDLENNVLAVSPNAAILPAAEPRRYIVRVRPPATAAPQVASFGLTVELTAP